MGISKFRSSSSQQVITLSKLKQHHTNDLYFYDYQTTAYNKKINKDFYKEDRTLAYFLFLLREHIFIGLLLYLSSVY